MYKYKIKLSALMVLLFILLSSALWAEDPIGSYQIIQDWVFAGSKPKVENKDYFQEKFITHIISIGKDLQMSESQWESSPKIEYIQFDETSPDKDTYQKYLKPDDLKKLLKLIGELRGRGAVIYLYSPDSDAKTANVSAALMYKTNTCYMIDTDDARSKNEALGSLINNFQTKILRTCAATGNCPIRPKEIDGFLYEWQADEKFCGDPYDFIEEMGYTLSSHARLIKSTADNNKTVIGVRNSGNYSLRRIRDGYPNKGHGILEKSIKPKTLNANKAISQKDKSKKIVLFQDDVMGLVGKWADNSPIAIYTGEILNTAEGYKNYKEEDPEKKQNSFKLVNLFNGQAVIESEIIKEQTKFGYTGDYDLQELIRIEQIFPEKSDPSNTYYKVGRVPYHSATSDPSLIFNQYRKSWDDKDNHVFTPVIPGDVKDKGYDTDILRELNDKIWPQRKISLSAVFSRNLPEQHFHLIQHGAQQNYYDAFIKDIHKHEKKIDALLYPDTEILFILPDSARYLHPSFKKEIIIIRNAEQLYLFYKILDIEPWWERKEVLEFREKNFSDSATCNKLPYTKPETIRINSEKNNNGLESDGKTFIKPFPADCPGKKKTSIKKE